MVELIMKKLRLKDSLTAQEGYHDVVRAMARKPYPALDGWAMYSAAENAKSRVGEVNPDEIVDDRFIRKLDESGFFQGTYGK